MSILAPRLKNQLLLYPIVGRERFVPPKPISKQRAWLGLAFIEAGTKTNWYFHGGKLVRDVLVGGRNLSITFLYPHTS